MFGGAFGIWQWVIVLVLVLLLFGGRGKISSLMGDFGKGLRHFKSGMSGDENDASQDDDLLEDAGAEKPAPNKKPAAKKSVSQQTNATKPAQKTPRRQTHSA